ncbi:MAG TPA: hypothetical protein VFC37_23825 [Terracidiphilus sp.]|nr:hypothetical protein [Terracidiphilus sp.]
MLQAVRLLVVCALVFLPGLLIAGEHFDGKWLTTLTCPAKGNTEGYTWKIPSVIQNGNFKAEHGTAGQPGYLLIEGPIAEDGSAKLSANGIVYSRKYARGSSPTRARITATTSKPNSKKLKAQARETRASAS